MSTKTLEVISLENKNRKYWNEAHKYFEMFKNNIKDLKDCSAAESLLDQDLNCLFLVKPKQYRKKVKILYRSKRRLNTLKEVLLAQAIEEQTLQLNRSTKKDRYRYDCRFIITASNLETIKGYHLLEKYGWYNSETNPNGVVKDHRLSVKYGYDHSISSEIIGHIRNCEFLLYNDNAKKSSNNSITLENLLNEIHK